MSLTPLKQAVNTALLGDGPNLDAFSRLRVSEPQSIFVSSQVYTGQPEQWETVTSGATATATHKINEALTELEVGQINGESVIQQTYRYFSYIPGKSQQIIATGVFSAGKENNTQRIAYGDDNNGVSFDLVNNVFQIIRRTSTSGAPVDNIDLQSDWNLDRFDGTKSRYNPSGLKLDTSKANIPFIDLQWLAVGRVRFGFDIDGKLIYCHEINNANLRDTVYMGSATLPVRFEIFNTGATASNTVLKRICVSVASEGGFTPPGISFGASSELTTRAFAAVSGMVPAFAIQLKQTFNTKDNHKTVKLKKISLYTDAAIAWRLDKVFAPSGVLTPNWQSAHADSCVNYSELISGVTGNPSHPINNGFLGASIGSSTGAQEISIDPLDEHNYIANNYDASLSQLFVLYIGSFAGTANVSRGMVWSESNE